MVYDAAQVTVTGQDEEGFHFVIISLPPLADVEARIEFGLASTANHAQESWVVIDCVVFGCAGVPSCAG